MKEKNNFAISTVRKRERRRNKRERESRDGTKKGVKQIEIKRERLKKKK